MRRSKLKFARTVLYSLKRRYGAPIDLYHIVSTEDNSETGVTTQVKEKYKIRRAILLPTILTREMRTIGVNIPANEMNSETRYIIIAKEDLPTNFDLNSDDYLITHERNNRIEQSGKRFNIKKMEQLEDDISILIMATYTEGTERDEIFDLRIDDELILIEGGGDDPSTSGDESFPAEFPITF